MLDQSLQMGGLIAHRAGRGGRLFDQDRVLLGHPVHFRNGQVDLFQARALLGVGRVDFTDDIGHLAHAADHAFHRAARLVHQARALLDVGHRTVDQLLDFARGGGRPLRQIAGISRYLIELVDNEMVCFVENPGGFKIDFE